MEKGFQQFGLLVTLFFYFLIPVSISVPFVLFHGVMHSCSDDVVSNFTHKLNKLSGSSGSCLEIGTGSIDSFFVPLMNQVNEACEKVKSNAELRQGYNIVAQSQGSLIARGLIEFCDNAPPVFNFISLGGPHSGVSKMPRTFNSLDGILDPLVYLDLFQDNVAPANYVKIPTDMDNYLKHSKYLPKLNNEKPEERNSTYKDRFTSLQNLVLIMFEDDKTVIPKESAWFGFYSDEASNSLLSPQETKLYTEDWIGLKTLDTAKKVQFFSVPNDHLVISEDEITKYILPYLNDKSNSSSDYRRNRKAM